ncbi:MAG: DUF4007 family protein [Candidatus Dadabacteria bacterium]|nr:DUF4007 family protein [Candidatus Dadabacteria bacterium]MDE0519720.1 DUF4007 family protein [Candidatus Dadabacteria bacterium]MDE0663059.1 DUF4007 family protein [Candidatus Dadabacteria bacterium]
MYTGPLADEKNKGHFTGHETFPLRYLWLCKAYEKVADLSEENHRKNPFSDPDAIVNFGVGKNMVNSIRHWSLACKIIEHKNGSFKPTSIGEFLFNPKTGRDPFMEKEATLWLIHWMVAGQWGRTSTWYYAFNYFSERKFGREDIVKSIQNLCENRKWKRTSETTIKRDVDCFLRSYVHQGDEKFSEDSIESVLSELELINAVGSHMFEFNYGPKPNLPEGVFLYSLNEFWQAEIPNQNFASVELLTYAPGSPGRVFKLDEQSLVERLVKIGESSGGRFQWTDTSGIRNVAKAKENIESMRLLDLSYTDN